MSIKADYQITERQEIEATIQVTVPAEGVLQQIEAVYREYAKEVRVPGFRKGHVPKSFLDSRFGREVFLQEALDALQRKHFPVAVAELELRPVSTPSLEIVESGEDSPLVFTASFAVLPIVSIDSTEGLKATVPPLKPVSEEDVNSALEEVQQQFSVLGEREGEEIADGDLVRVKEGEQEWDTRAMQDNPITQHLVGATVGSTVEIDAELPDGKPLQTSLEIVGLRQVILPDVDDDLAKDAGYDDLATLKKDIEEKISKRRKDLREQWLHSALLDDLLGKTEIPLPDAFIDDLVSDEISRMKESLERPESNRTFAEYLEQRELSEDELRDEIKTSVEGRVRRELLMRQLADDLEIAIDDDELGRLAEEEAASYDEDPVRFTARLKAEDRWEDYRIGKVNERIFETLEKTAVITEQEPQEPNEEADE